MVAVAMGRWWEEWVHGVFAGGFAIVLFHQSKKLSTPEWVQAVSTGKLSKAITSLSPVKPAGPWWVLCDNEILECKKDSASLPYFDSPSLANLHHRCYLPFCT